MVGATTAAVGLAQAASATMQANAKSRSWFALFMRDLLLRLAEAYGLQLSGLAFLGVSMRFGCF
jgi:hypothetical protein